jgi:Flp pilus assembly protein TadG
MTKANRRDEGAALVELSFVFVVLCIFALCFTALGQLFIEYHHVSGAARAAARYATKADYDPTRVPASSSRRPTAEEVAAFARQAAAPLPAAEIGVALAPDSAAGNGLNVRVTHTAQGGAYGLVTGMANAFLGFVGAELPPVTLHADATAIYE